MCLQKEVGSQSLRGLVSAEMKLAHGCSKTHTAADSTAILNRARQLHRGVLYKPQNRRPAAGCCGFPGAPAQPAAPDCPAPQPPCSPSPQASVQSFHLYGRSAAMTSAGAGYASMPALCTTWYPILCCGRIENGVQRLPQASRVQKSHRSNFERVLD